MPQIEERYSCQKTARKLKMGDTAGKMVPSAWIMRRVRDMQAGRERAILSDLGVDAVK
jgi:hypothetical protein